MNMKKSTVLKSLFVLALIGFGLNSFSQNLTVNTESLRRHGYDAASALVAYESKDSVTTGSKMRYYVVPDATANPLYTGVLTGTLASTFAWFTALPTLTAAGVSANVTGFAAFGNYQEVTWSGVGTINLNVQETSGSSCVGSITTTPIVVIAPPTATFGADPSSVCNASPVQSFTLPVTLSTSVNDLPTAPNGSVRINYTVFNPDATELIAAQDKDIIETAANFSVTLTGATQFGTYYVIINSVTDRISRKPLVDVLGSITDNRIDLVVNRTPNTGAVYHIPNM